jgi:hypothetical protein
MFNPSRDQARQFLIDAWAKHRQRLPGTAMEALAADLVALHPEYHALLEAEDALTREWTPEQGETNPFLHLSLPSAKCSGAPSAASCRRMVRLTSTAFGARPDDPA